MEVTLQESIFPTESLLLIKCSWQQLQKWTVIHKTICQENNTYWHLLEKKKRKYKEGQLSYISQGSVVFVFTLKICKNFTLKEKFELTTTSIYWEHNKKV